MIKQFLRVIHQQRERFCQLMILLIDAFLPCDVIHWRENLYHISEGLNTIKIQSKSFLYSGYLIIYANSRRWRKLRSQRKFWRSRKSWRNPKPRMNKIKTLSYARLKSLHPTDFVNPMIVLCVNR